MAEEARRRVVEQQTTDDEDSKLVFETSEDVKVTRTFDQMKLKEENTYRELTLLQLNNGTIEVQISNFDKPFSLKTVKFLADIKYVFLDLRLNPTLSRIALDLSPLKSMEEFNLQLSSVFQDSKINYFHRE